MHPSYALYLFLCTLQLPVFITLYSIGHRVDCGMLLPTQDQGGNQTHHHAVVVVAFQQGRYRLDPHLLAMCTAAGCFSVFYMLLNHIDREQLHGEFLTQPDAGPPLCSYAFAGADTDMRRALHLARICFWVFVWMQGLVLTAHCVYARGGDLWLALCALNSTRIAALFAWCRTAPWERWGVPQALGVAAYVWWMTICIRDKLTFDPLADNDERWRWALLFTQAGLLDFLFVLSHTWDLTPSMQLILNCRLFYVALSASLAQAAGLWR